MSYLPMIMAAVLIMAALVALALTPDILHRMETRRQMKRKTRRKS